MRKSAPQLGDSATVLGGDWDRCGAGEEREGHQAPRAGGQRLNGGVNGGHELAGEAEARESLEGEALAGGGGGRWGNRMNLEGGGLRPLPLECSG